MNFDKLKKQLILHESLKTLPYDDQTGVEIKQGATLHGKITIGIGHNLTDNGISPLIADFLYFEDVAGVLAYIYQTYPWWVNLDDVRQRVMVDLIFNLGFGGFAQFKNTIAAIQRHDFEAAAKGLETSAWYGQVGTRGARLVKMMRLGVDPIELSR